MKKKIVIFSIILMLASSSCFVNIALAESRNEYEVPDYVKVGDLLYMDYPSEYHPLKNFGRMNDHVALFIGDDQFVHVHRLFGVEVRDYEYFLTKYAFHTFGYVLTANCSQKEDAANWAQNKIGQRYQYSTRTSKKGSNNRWYQAELVWAAYYNQGIDIDKNGWDDSRLVTIQEIIDDFDTETYTTHTVPSYVQRGDILLMDMKKHGSYWAIPGNYNDHAAIYLGHGFRDGSYFIHASGLGVAYVTFDYFHPGFENFTFYYVKEANESVIEGAIEWGESQLGSNYQCFFLQISDPRWWYWGMFELGEKCADPDNELIKTSDRFYCSEFVWAAYYNQGIDIDQNGWEKIKPVPNNNVPRFFRNWWERHGWAFIYVDCDDIINSKNTTERLPLL